MSPKEHLAALAKIRANRGLPPKAPRTTRGNPCRAPPAAPAPAATMISYAEVANPSPTPSVVSAMTVPTAAGAPPASTGNALCQVLANTLVPPTVAPTVESNTTNSNDEKLYLLTAASIVESSRLPPCPTISRTMSRLRQPVHLSMVAPTAAWPVTM